MPDEIPAVAASLIRALRKGAGLTQSRLARALGLDASTVSRYEKGDLAPSETVVRLLLLYLRGTNHRDYSAMESLANEYGIAMDELNSQSTAVPALTRRSRSGNWLDGATVEEKEILRDFWIARRLGDPDLVAEIDNQIRAIKRISQKRGVWFAENTEESA